MMSPRWGYYDVAPLGLLLYRPSGAIMISPLWGYYDIAPLGLNFNSFKNIYKLYFLFRSVKISFSVVTVSESRQEKGSFGFLSVCLCAGKNQMCHFACGLFCRLPVR